MSTERLSAKEMLNLIIDREVVNIPFNIRSDFQRKLTDNGSYQIALKAIEEYAAQRNKHIIEQRDKALDERDNARIWIKSLQKERDDALQQTKQLREEREQIHSYLTRLVEVFEHGLAVYPLSCLHRDGKQLLDQSNQQNERKDTICD